VFAVARDGVLPMSGWIGQVDDAGQPRHAVTVMYIFAATLLCTILPSQVAFFSLISAGAVPTIAAYGLIALLRLTLTPNNFKNSYFFLGRYRKLCYVVVAVFNALVVSVSSEHILMYLSDFWFRLCYLRFSFPSTVRISILCVFFFLFVPKYE